MGATGPAGAAGAQGPTGPAGATGATGPRGPGASFEDDGASGWGLDPSTAAQELVAIVDVPVGSTATDMTVYGEDTSVTYTVYGVDLLTGTSTNLGSGVVGSSLDFTDFSRTTSNYLAVIVDTADATGDTVFGAQVTVLEPSTTIYTNALGSAAGWTFSDFPAGGAVWAVDATPGGVPGGPFNSAPTSLNYNDGVNYVDTGANQGIATSPGGVINLTGSTNPQLKFFCNYETDTTGTATDKRDLLISNNGFVSTLLTANLATVGPVNIDPCAAMGTWHQHTVALDPAWGTIQLRFRFLTVNATANAFAGWFVDDLLVTGATSSVLPVTPDRFLSNDD